MNDPHVVALIYGVTHSEGASFDQYNRIEDLSAEEVRLAQAKQDAA